MDHKIAKTITYRLGSFIICTAIVWVVIGKIGIAALVGIAEDVVSTIWYYVHECIWEKRRE